MTHLINDAINLKKTTKYHEPLIKNHLVEVQKKLSKIINDSDRYKEFYSTSSNEYKMNIATSPSACEIIYAYHELIPKKTKSVLIKALTSNNYFSSEKITKRIEKYNVDVIFVCDNDVEWNEDEVSNKIRMISLAYEFINSSTENVFDITCSFVREIVFYRTNDSVMNSKSSHLSIGKIEMTNFNYTSLLEFVEVLVHESFHSYLHSIEEMECRFLSDTYFDKEEPEYVVSPWSGMKIDLWSYTHAILVWSYLHNFWVNSLNKVNYLNQFGIKDDELLSQIKVSYKGFINDKAFVLLDSKERMINKLYFDSVFQLKEKGLHVSI